MIFKFQDGLDVSVEANAESKVEALQAEWDKTPRSDVVINNLMNSTFEDRRNEVLNGHLTINQLLAKYPALHSSLMVRTLLLYLHFLSLLFVHVR